MKQKIMFFVVVSCLYTLRYNLYSNKTNKICHCYIHIYKIRETANCYFFKFIVLFVVLNITLLYLALFVNLRAMDERSKIYYQYRLKADLLINYFIICQLYPLLQKMKIKEGSTCGLK